MTTMNNELAVMEPKELVRQSTDIAGLCKDIVIKTAIEIQKRKYVRVEGWMAIATAHGCVASARDVERIEGGFRAIGEIRKISNGDIISTAEGFVGEDEPTWFGGELTSWDYKTRQNTTKTLPKRPDYAIRAMAQTRAISRACRSAFAHVVVLMDAGLSTTPAEEVPSGGFNDDAAANDAAIQKREQTREDAARSVGAETPADPYPDHGKSLFTGDWRSAQIHFGADKGKMLGELKPQKLSWWQNEWTPRPYKGAITPDAQELRDALDASMEAPVVSDAEEEANKILQANQNDSDSGEVPF